MRPWFVAGRLKFDIRVDGNHETVNIWRLNRPFKLGGPMKPLRAALAILLLTGSLAAQEPKKSLPPRKNHPKPPATSPSTPEAQPASTPAGKLSCGQCIPSNKPIVKGVDRWSVKTSLPSGSDPAHAKTVAIADFIALVDPPAANEADKLFQQTRIPPFNNSLNVKEGDLVTLKGWLWLVALENEATITSKSVPAQPLATIASSSR